MPERSVRALVLTGLGITCEAETLHAVRLAGGEPLALHFNDLVERPIELARSHLLVLPGGFSFGDHLGAGRVLAHRLRSRLGPDLGRFIADGGLVLGICNGFQTMVRLGLLPDGAPGPQTLALAPNRHGAFHDGWVTVRADPDSPCIFTRGISTIELPVRHGEGQLRCAPSLLQEMQQAHLPALRYVNGEGQPTQVFPGTPNGSVDAIAGVCDRSGRIFGLMPHPEAFLYRESHPHWRRRRDQREAGAGLQIFRNAVEAARG